MCRGHVPLEEPLGREELGANGANDRRGLARFLGFDVRLVVVVGSFVSPPVIQ